MIQVGSAKPGGAGSVGFAVLGPVRVRAGGGDVDLGARQTRLMAALLLVRAGRAVRGDEFAELLWGDEPPAQAANIVHRHIGALRRMLEPGLTTRQEGHWLRRQDGGYLLRVDAGNLDLLRFRQLAEEARAAGDPRSAVKLYLEALRLWADRCAAGLDPAPGFAPEFTAVDDERSAVACAAADACLATGEVTDIVPGLRAVAAVSPFDEAVQARLLLVLAAAGRQAEAVELYQNVRARLAGDLGVDPGAELRAAYDRVLRQQVLPAPIVVPAPQPALASAPAVVPAQLPSTTRFFHGRREQLAALDDLLPGAGERPAGVITVAVDGLPGVGKTCLVVHWAHTVAPRFPDGQFYVDLRGFAGRDAVDPGQALSRLLHALGVPYPEIPQGLEAKSSLYRSLMAGRRMLVLLDNARDVEQVRPLIPATAGCLVAVTSRNRLAGLIAQEGAHLLTLDVPSVEEARAGLRRRIGPEDGDARALDAILRRCGRLPLAMAIVAARAAAQAGSGLRDIAAELSADDTLDAFDGGEPSSDLRTVFSWSYRLLSPPAARLFRLLSLHPGPDFGPAAAASLIAGTPRETLASLNELARSRLLTEFRRRRYAFHDLVRAYAAELTAELDTPADRDEAAARMLDHLQWTAYAADRALGSALPDRPDDPRAGVTPERPGTVAEAIEWFAAEQYVLEAAIEHPPVAGAGVWQLAEALMPYYQRRGMHEPWARTAGRALRVAAGDVLGRAHMHRMLAGANAFAGDSGPAIQHLRESLRLFGELGRAAEQAYVHINLGWVHYRQGEDTVSLEHYRRAGDLFVQHRDRRGEGLALLGRGYVHTRLGEVAGALGCLTRAATIFEDLEDADGGGSCAAALADVCLALGRDEQAVAWRRRAVELFERAGNAVEYARAGLALGDDQLRAGRPEAAAPAWQAALAAFRDVGDVERAAEAEERLRLT
jgi:DNA-binding SARP family transcriptional activator/tetratricopeptide (TPR) repeat protein